MEKFVNDDTGCRERRYQWLISGMLVVMGFLAGVFFESERMKAQVVTNTVEIRILKENLQQIDAKLNMLLTERRSGT